VGNMELHPGKDLHVLNHDVGLQLKLQRPEPQSCSCCMGGGAENSSKYREHGNAPLQGLM